MKDYLIQRIKAEAPGMIHYVEKMIESVEDIPVEPREKSDDTPVTGHLDGVPTMGGSSDRSDALQNLKEALDQASSTHYVASIFAPEA